MHYISSGQGSAVILIHGLFGNLDNLKGLGRNLEERHRVVRIDVPNHGLSPHWQKMDYPLLAQAVIELMDSLQIEAAHILGHSMGGKVAMATALSYPNRVTSLIAADIAPVSYEERHEKVFSGLENIDLIGLKSRSDALKQLLTAGLDEGTAQFLLKNLSRTDEGFNWKMNLAGLKSCYKDLIAWHNDIEADAFLQYRKPTLFIRAGDSDYVTAEHRQAIISQFPQVQAKTIEGTGHWLHAQKPAIFNRIVIDFLAKHDGK
ncbi:putative hydrolase or acyltransferase of alpha/beta superfamily [Shewanella psychrophila]|uniref:Putative hydrolase or acyltransferase of alpha/beta superfamily n=1 Tax=Shewanella psychrophila TaxID=225848 RepID=A0A1S6HKC8_9GAMM|nr:alpha/beta fold hydrolase [Shewanella psychrophila]AQS35977.1 putative hydrolase or acyltransferase of alpha/beta superfamily [Shewanella psychrophila]